MSRQQIGGIIRRPLWGRENGPEVVIPLPPDVRVFDLNKEPRRSVSPKLST